MCVGNIKPNYLAFNLFCIVLHVAISAGHAHSAIISDSGRLYLAGSNHFGQLGLGDSETKKANSPKELSFNLDDLDDGPNAG